MNLGARLSRERQRVDTEDILVLATQVVLHDGDLVQHGGIAQRQVQHSAQVLFERAGHRTILGPVAGIVRTHRQLVDVEACGGAGYLKELGSHHTGHAQLGGNSHRSGRGGLCDLGGQVLRGGNHLVTDGIHLDGLDNRPGAHLAALTSSHQRRKLAGERHLLLG